jgi:hypothetical protein
MSIFEPVVGPQRRCLPPCHVLEGITGIAAGLPELTTMTGASTGAWNQHPAPFSWTKAPDDIPRTIERAKTKAKVPYRPLAGRRSIAWPTPAGQEMATIKIKNLMSTGYAILAMSRVAAGTSASVACLGSFVDGR